MGNFTISVIRVDTRHFVNSGHPSCGTRVHNTTVRVAKSVRPIHGVFMQTSRWFCYFEVVYVSEKRDVVIASFIRSMFTLRSADTSSHETSGK